MTRRPWTRLVALALLVGISGCESYHRDLGPRPEPKPAPTPHAEPAPPPAPAPAEAPKPKPAPTPPAEPAGPDVREIPPSAPSPSAQAPPEAGFEQAFPGVRIDVARKVVEFDAQVSPIIFAPYEGRFFYLEDFVCKAGTKDHESLVVTKAAPSHIHAALLLIGLEPGHPVTWDHPDGKPVARPPSGPDVDVAFVLNEGTPEERIVDPRAWTKVKGGEGRFPAGHWVFAGSNIAGTKEHPYYEADAAGTIVGLASFGTEVIAWPRVISAEEAEGQLEWVADLDAIAPAETPVVVRVSAVR